jgi:hypothetical protein
MNIFVVGMYEKIPAEAISVNTTSKSDHWSRDLSPFFLGPVDLYCGLSSKNMENGWQFAKVYPEHVDKNGDPNQDYWLWATKGWDDSFAHRYPMGKGRKPLYSFWNKEKLGYIEARKQIYMPLYAKAVAVTKGFAKLKEIYQGEKDIYLRDYDGYNHKKLEMSYQDVINCESRKMGHAFVLAMMLENYIEYTDE